MLPTQATSIFISLACRNVLRQTLKSRQLKVKWWSKMELCAVPFFFFRLQMTAIARFTATARRAAPPVKTKSLLWVLRLYIFWVFPWISVIFFRLSVWASGNCDGGKFRARPFGCDRCNCDVNKIRGN